MNRSLMSPVDQTVHLDWHGPYAITDGVDALNLLTTKPSVAMERGVYLWTILIGDEYWVYYVGKADNQKGVLGRLGTEFRRKAPIQAYIDDPAKLLIGERVNLYQPRNCKGLPNEEGWQKNPEHFAASYARFFEIIRVFVAPMPNALEFIPEVEGMLCEILWKFEDANWGSRADDGYYYLSNGGNGLKRPKGPRKITMSFPVKIRGFEQVNEWRACDG